MTYLPLTILLLVLFVVSLHRPPKRKPDWRHLTNRDRLDIYERARFDALGDADLEPNLRREADGIEAKALILQHCRWPVECNFTGPFLADMPEGAVPWEKP